MSVTDPVLAATIVRLTEAGCVAASEEAAELVAAAPDVATIDAWTHRREQGEPLPWITGRVEFCGLMLHAAPGVYVPRAQTEELARRAASVLPDTGRAVDLCTGTGAVAAHLMARAPAAAVIGTDIDARAAACARGNGVPTVVADLGRPLRHGDLFDVVTAVAPYVPTGGIRLLPADVQRHEPRLALDGGADGLDILRRIVVDAAELLRVGGWLLVEVGGDQHEALAPTLAANGFGLVTSWDDDEGDLRGLGCRWGGAHPRV